VRTIYKALEGKEILFRCTGTVEMTKPGKRSFYYIKANYYAISFQQAKNYVIQTVSSIVPWERRLSWGVAADAGFLCATAFVLRETIKEPTKCS